MNNKVILGFVERLDERNLGDSTARQRLAGQGALPAQDSDRLLISDMSLNHPRESALSQLIGQLPDRSV